MKKFSKLLSVTLSLALCASMIAPAMALDIDQAYIDGLDVKTHDRYGTEYVEVKGEDGDDTFNMTEDIKTEYTLYFGQGGDVTLNMNGHTVDHQGEAGSVIFAEDTDLTINGADEEGNMGTITGGNASEKNSLLGAQEADSGGGIHVENGNLTVKDTVISDNTATHNGSAVFVKDSDKVTMDNVIVENNAATGKTGSGGGTLANVNVDEVNLTDVVIRDNTSVGVGGGLHVQNNVKSGTVNMTNVEITGNTSTNEGGVFVPQPQGGGMYVSHVDEINMENVTISGNTAKSVTTTEIGAGGGVYAYDVGKIDMEKVAITDNKAGFGGGVYAYDVGEIEMTDTQITGNTATDGNGIGGGMYVFSYTNETTVTGSSTVIADNTAWGGNYANDVFAWGYGSNVNMEFGPVTYGDKVFDGWSDSMTLGEFVREGEEADENGAFGNSYPNGDYGYMTFHWTEKPEDGGDPPVPPVTPPVVPPTPDPDPEDPPVDIDEPDVPLGELPDEDVEIDEPEIPLEELPEIEIDEPDVPLDGTPQTGDASVTALWAVMFAVSLAGAAILFTRKERNA